MVENALLVLEEVERQLARREDPRRVLAVVGELINRDHHLVAERIGTRLSALAAHDVDDLVGPFDQRIAEPEEAGAALLHR